MTSSSSTHLCVYKAKKEDQSVARNSLIGPNDLGGGALG